MKRLIVWTLEFYHQISAMLFGARCRFHPSCSEYAKEAIEKKGIASGVLEALCRLARCHPFHPGGYDPVPPNGKP